MKACSTCAHGQVVVGHLPIYGMKEEDRNPPMVECRFHAPQPITGPVNDNFDRVSYPPLQAHDYWCGQWQPQEPKMSFTALTNKELWETVAKNGITAKEMHCPDTCGDDMSEALRVKEQIVTYDSN